MHVTYLGYQKESLPVQKGKEMIFQLKPEAISLKEVEIKGGRIYGRQDTVKYNLSRFTSGKEQSIKEALKKLPGIDINEQSGEIRYNGKAISQFTVEGMDVSGGRYNQITENLKVDAVKDAEVIEHFQPIRSLRNKMPSDKVALNLTLKPEVLVPAGYSPYRQPVDMATQYYITESSMPYNWLMNGKASIYIRQTRPEKIFPPNCNS